ncbi:MAG: TonB-dependent receptor [Paludibacter sp.]|nr:TonB-dependent receptor [Paludibacter sp.]
MKTIKTILLVGGLVLSMINSSTVQAGNNPVTGISDRPFSMGDSLSSYHLNEVAVVGNNKKGPAVAKTNISVMDLPQALIVIDENAFKAQQISNITDLLKNVNGMYIMSTTGGYQEEIASRGTSLTSSNTFKNGIRYYGGMKTEISGIEKAEILKGNTALLFGNVAAGGVLNLVTKKPKFDVGGNVAFTYGSFDRYKPQFDFYGALNKQKTIAFRLNGSYEQANSFRKYVNSKTWYINPSFIFNVTPRTSILLEGDYTNTETTPDFGTGIVNYQLVDIPRDRFLGVSWGKYKANQSFMSAKITHAFNDKLSISSLTGLRYYNTDLFSNTRPNTSGSVIAQNGDWKRNIQRSGVDDSYFIEQVDLNANFKTGSVKHQALVGFDVESSETKTIAYNQFSNYDVINIFNAYNPALEAAIPSMTANTLTKNPIDRYGIYAQDLISLQKYIKLLLGVRYSNIESTSHVYTYATQKTTGTKATDHPFSPKAGLTIQPTRQLSVFTSYSNSFALNTGTDINGNALDPSIIDQYEIGIKNKLLKNKLSVNATVYQINNSNLAQTSLENGNTNSNIKELAGATKGQGAELDMEYLPWHNLRIMAGYSYTKTTYTASNTYIVGSELRYNPKNTANVSANYMFEKGALKNLQLGFISSYVGERFAGRSTRLTVQNDAYKLIPLSAYLLHDITLGYDLKKWNFKVKLANITNALSYNVHDDNSLNPIAPFNFSVNVQYNIN